MVVCVRNINNPVPVYAQHKPVVKQAVVQAVQATAPAPVAQEAVAEVTPPPPTPTYVPGTNDAMQYIFAHESGGNPHAINASSGACGLGQALPCSKLLNVCGSLDNVDCQISFFTNYAVSRYGGWVEAMYFWQGNHWW